MLVVGGVFPSMPMRTPLTPALPTAMWFCEIATAVSGSSTRTRAGDASLLTLGFTARVELISIRIPSALGTTFTRWSWLCWPEAAAGVAAGAGAGLAAGIVAGFTVGAGEPGAGFAVCAARASGFSALPAPAIIAIARMPVVSFIAVLFLRPRLGRARS